MDLTIYNYNMKKLVLSLLLLAGFSCCIYAQVSTERDHRTNPDRYYLNYEDVASSLKLLPPPPEVTSIQFLWDDAQYKKGKMMRSSARGEQAVRDASPGADSFSSAFGCEISQENTPEIYKLISTMREDAGDLSTREAKNYYMRPRPYMFYSEDISVPGAQRGLSTNGSYPSGHTAIGWATALVLAEINVENQDAILIRGYEMGQSRVISGFHFQSDVDAGRLVSAAVVARLHANDEFNAQLKKAKKEFEKLKKAGKIQKVTVE